MGYWDTTVSNHLAAIAATAKAETPALPPLTSAETYMGIELQHGQRVLDKLTGSLGTVISGTVQHTITPAAKPADPNKTPAFFALPTPGRKTVITVQLDVGGIVTRTPAELVRAPSSLTLPLADLAAPE